MKKSSGYQFYLRSIRFLRASKFLNVASISLLALAAILSVSFLPVVAKEEAVGEIDTLAENWGRGALTVELTTQFGDGQNFYAGDQVSLLLSLDQPGYLLMFYSDSLGQITKIFPNTYDRNALYPAGDFMAIPRESSAFKLVVGPPFGTDHVWVFISSGPLDLKPVANESLAQLKVRARSLAVTLELSYGESSVSFVTSPR